VDQAFVANEILTNLIKACFDPVYGSDHFSIGELLETAQDFQEHGAQVGNNNNDDLDDKMLIDKALPKVSDNRREHPPVAPPEGPTAVYEHNRRSPQPDSQAQGA